MPCFISSFTPVLRQTTARGDDEFVEVNRIRIGDRVRTSEKDGDAGFAGVAGILKTRRPADLGAFKECEGAALMPGAIVKDDDDGMFGPLRGDQQYYEEEGNAKTCDGWVYTLLLDGDVSHRSGFVGAGIICLAAGHGLVDDGDAPQFRFLADRDAVRASLAAARRPSVDGTGAVPVKYRFGADGVTVVGLVRDE